ncbi:GAF domain-containing protein [Mitsuaria sp. WAJ17]|uniref:ATP-binding protein n=1 Tax=Mitsuaria sp. WAJ17 TaxID=2761452 RepID=UPI0016036D6B|nr:ATP-binding protein [Mitsuaria sp. WAJ17]MBB2485075.1 GAF domain-containing protein [Mitsuaria sp. WAJ17]
MSSMPGPNIEQALRALNLAIGALHGGAFFETVSGSLARELAVQVCFLGKIEHAPQGLRAQLLAFWQDGRQLPPFNYSLQGTPCRNVADGAVCYHASGVKQAYPTDSLLAEIGVQSYLGLPLVDGEGLVIGLLCIMDRAPIPWERRLFALELMQALAGRCSAELLNLLAREHEQLLLMTHGQRELRATGRLIEQERLAALGGLVTGMTHDIASPIGVAVTACSGLDEFAQRLLQSLRGGRLTAAEAAELAQRIADASQLAGAHLRRASDLLSGFKTYAADQSQQKVSAFDLCEYLRNILRVHGALLKGARARLELDLPDAAPVVMCGGQLSQLLAKLLRNSCAHAFEGIGDRRITLSLQREDDWARLHYRDNGRGLPAPLREQLLQGWDAVQDQGLGLHLVAQLCQMMQGRIRLDPDPRPGTGYIIELPLNPPEQG